MALGGVNVSLNEAVPSATSSAGLGYQDIQSLKTTFQLALDSEHIFSATGGTGSGAHRKGSAVAFYGGSSAISSSDTDGRLMVDSSKSRLFHAGSADTRLLGSQYLVESCGTLNLAATLTASKITQVWATECGQAVIPKTSASTIVTLQQTYLTGMVVVSPLQMTIGGSYLPGVPAGTIAGNALTIYHFQFNSTGTSSNAASLTTYAVNYIVMGIKSL